MIFAALSFLISGLAAFAMLVAFTALVPRLGGDGKSVASFFVQWALILTLVVPATLVAMVGPICVHTGIFDRETTIDQRTWLAFGGVVLFVLCGFAAFRAPPGKMYSSWRSRVDQKAIAEPRL